MPRVPSPPLGVWSVDANNAKFSSLKDTLATLVEGITPITQSFRRDLLAFYKATKLIPHPQLLPFHPDEEDPTSNGELLTPGNSAVVYDLADVDTLTVKNWQLDDGSFAGLCFALQHCPRIHTAVFFNAQLRADQVETLCRLLPRTQVTRFHLEWNTLPPTDAELDPAVFAELLTISSNISTLSLRSCGLKLPHVEAIARALRSNTKLVLLNLFENAVGDDGAMEIAYALPFNTSLRSLSLGNCGLSGKAAKVLVNVVSPKYVAPPSLLKMLEDAESRIHAELDQAKKAKKKLDRHAVIQSLGLPVLETVEGVQYASGNAVLQDLILSGNEAIEESDVLDMNGVLEKHHQAMKAHLRRIKLQRIASLKPLITHMHTHQLSPILHL